jgi:hypothetical protein
MTEQVYFEDVSEGDEIPSLAKNCSTQQLVMWAAASGDFYQIHYDIDFAKSMGLDNLIVHGRAQERIPRTAGARVGTPRRLRASVRVSVPGHGLP